MSALRRLLLPLTPLYRLALAVRERRLASGGEPVRRLARPVVSIGNLSTGGSGKTPLTIALAQALTRRAVAVDVLSRGYRRASRIPARVNPAGTAAESGDEPVLIARSAGIPVFVSAQRYDAGILAESMSESRSAGPRAVHLLDDGFQHRQLHRDIDIVLFNRADLRDRLLPAGNLRETLRAVSRAQIIAIASNDPALESDVRVLGWTGPIWRLRRQMNVPSISGPVLAFCGIARPEQFFAGLEAAGLNVAARTAFRDHHRYTLGDLRHLQTTARAVGAVHLITTEKDAVRLEPIVAALDRGITLAIAPLRVEIEDEGTAIDWLLGRLFGPCRQPPM